MVLDEAAIELDVQQRLVLVCWCVNSLGGASRGSCPESFCFVPFCLCLLLFFCLAWPLVTPGVERTGSGAAPRAERARLGLFAWLHHPLLAADHPTVLRSGCGGPGGTSMMGFVANARVPGPGHHKGNVPMNH